MAPTLRCHRSSRCGLYSVLTRLPELVGTAHGSPNLGADQRKRGMCRFGSCYYTTRGDPGVSSVFVGGVPACQGELSPLVHSKSA